MIIRYFCSWFTLHYLLFKYHWVSTFCERTCVGVCVGGVGWGGWGRSSLRMQEKSNFPIKLTFPSIQKISHHSCSCLLLKRKKNILKSLTFVKTNLICNLLNYIKLLCVPFKVFELSFILDKTRIIRQRKIVLTIK